MESVLGGSQDMLPLVLNLPRFAMTLDSPPSSGGSHQCSLRMASCSNNLVTQESALILHLFFVFFFSFFFLSVPNLFQFEVKEFPNYCFVCCGGSLPTANFSTSGSCLQKLAVSTFQLIAYWHTPDSKYLCSSRESLIQLSTWSCQPGL